MHIMVARLSAVYLGRGETELAPYNRIVIHKADGTVSIHGDKGFKPMNYMATAAKRTETVNEREELVWCFTAGKETLTITFHEVFNEIELPLGIDDPGHSDRQGTESQLQEWLSKNLSTLDSTLEFVQREYDTGAGPVDLLARRGEELVAIEVKRSAPMATVGQVVRYQEAIADHRPDVNVTAMIAAVEFKGTTADLARKKGVQCLLLPEDWQTINDGPEKPSRTLFDL